MASFNHHPLLPEVLATLQKHQLQLESNTRAQTSSAVPDHHQLFTELPWTTSLDSWKHSRRAAERAEEARMESERQNASAWGLERFTGALKVEEDVGPDDEEEDEDEALKYALYKAGELRQDQMDGTSDIEESEASAASAASSSHSSQHASRKQSVEGERRGSEGEEGEQREEENSSWFGL